MEEAKVIEDPLIQRQYDEDIPEEGEGEGEEGEGCLTLRAQVCDEVKKQIGLAGPLIAVSLLQYSLEIISIMFVGHLGQLPLSSASMATSFAAFTGFSLLIGMGSALETLCGQAYGAKQYHMLGIQMQRAMVTLTALSIPLAFVWFYTSTIFIVLGQDQEISITAGAYIRWMIPSLFAYALLQCLNRFLQTQNLVVPMMITSGVTALLHVLLCWILVFKLGLEVNGAALANNISNWTNVVLLGMYVKFSPCCTNTWTGFSKEALNDLFSFIKLAVPSAFMICLEYWSFDMVVLLSGLLPNPKLETSVLSISLNTCWMVYMISVGLGGAISTRVSNELGAARPKGARLAVRVVVVIAIFEGLIVGSVTILVRNVWGKLYSDDEEVIKYVARMMPLLALSDFLDGFQCVLSGAARGCGWQNTCAIINLGAYYVVGIPCALLFAFILHVGGMVRFALPLQTSHQSGVFTKTTALLFESTGQVCVPPDPTCTGLVWFGLSCNFRRRLVMNGLWLGIICALSVQVVALVVINLFTNWDDEALKAVNRVQESIDIK